MIFSSSDTRRGKAVSLLGRNTMYALVVSLCLASLLVVLIPNANANSVIQEKAKEIVIQDILKKLAALYYVFAQDRGKTFAVIIKDFSLEDEKTFAVVDDKAFWVIILPARMKKDLGEESVGIGQEFALKKVRKDLIALTRAKGLKRQFTVPLRAQELPHPK